MKHHFFKPSTIASLALALLTAGGLHAAEQQGVTKTEIVVGTIQDLSGPLAGYGKQARNGMQLRIDELNEQGGVHGRQIKLLVEDSGYDPKKAVLAAQKLVNQDKIFIMAGHLGTAQNNAAMPIQFEKKVVNFMPLTAAREMYEAPNELKYALLSSYYDQMRLTLPKLAADKNAKKICIIYQDDEFGLEVLRGSEAGLKTVNMELTEKTSFKRGATDFSSQVAKMKSAGCELVVLGTIIRETIGTVAEARKNGFNPVFFASVAAYTDLIHKLGGKAMDGIYATMVVQNPYTDEASQPIRFWANKYKTKFNEDPAVFSAYGYTMIDIMIQAAQKAGPQLTTESFVKAMNGLTVPSDIFGTPKLTYTATKRLGSEVSRLSQIQDGKWRPVADGK
jgi:branched-chain amino acid transport system substrate-binding protein